MRELLEVVWGEHDQPATPSRKRVSGWRRSIASTSDLAIASTVVCVSAVPDKNCGPSSKIV